MQLDCMPEGTEDYTISFGLASVQDKAEDAGHGRNPFVDSRSCWAIPDDVAYAVDLDDIDATEEEAVAETRMRYAAYLATTDVYPEAAELVRGILTCASLTVGSDGLTVPGALAVAMETMYGRQVSVVGAIDVTQLLRSTHTPQTIDFMHM
eukprot:5147425-Amphidinium_carterae.1